MRRCSPCLAKQSKTAGASCSRPIVGDTEGSAWGTLWCERPKYNMTPRSGNIAKWMDENVEEIMRDSRDYAIDGEYWCEVLHGRLIVIPAIQNTELNRKQHEIVTHFNGITENIK